MGVCRTILQSVLDGITRVGGLDKASSAWVEESVFQTMAIGDETEGRNMKSSQVERDKIRKEAERKKETKGKHTIKVKACNECIASPILEY